MSKIFLLAVSFICLFNNLFIKEKGSKMKNDLTKQQLVIFLRFSEKQ